MIPPRLTVCRDCKHFELDIDSGQKGLCHRYPPQNVGVIVNKTIPGQPGQMAQELITNSAFPMVFPTNYCGEFQMSLLVSKAN